MTVRKPLSEETKKKMREAKIGVPRSEETKKKLREAMLGNRIGLKHPMFGKHWSEEVRNKIRKTLTGKYCGENSPMFGTHQSEETKKKLREANFGKVASEETKCKMRQLVGEKGHNWKGGLVSKNLASYDTYAPQISWCESVRRDPEEESILQVKCAYCGRWYKPTMKAVSHRVENLNGKTTSEARFYCSDGCKQACPIYKQRTRYKFQKGDYTREVQAQLRQMVFERDNWACIKCTNTKELHCHHIEGIRWEPLESTDIDKCVTLCKNCHKQIHKIEGCNPSDMRCNNLG